MNFITGDMPLHEALRQATTEAHDPDALRAAQRASEALQALLATVGPALLAWSFMQANHGVMPTAQEQRAGLEMLADSIEEALAAARAIVQ